MILTGKAKEDFENYVLNKKLGHDSEVLISVYNQESLFINYNNVKKTLLTALIIQWFDSVGIYINTTYEEYEDIQVKNLPVKIKTWSVWIKWINELLLEGFNSRQEALTEAIKKANEIYNNKN